MLQQESGHGIVWALNNADASGGIHPNPHTVQSALTEWSLWSKRQACLDNLLRQPAFPEIFLRYLGLGLCDEHRREELHWDGTSFFFFFLRSQITRLSSRVLSQQATRKRRHPLQSHQVFIFTHFVSSTSLGFFLVLNTLEGETKRKKKITVFNF